MSCRFPGCDHQSTRKSSLCSAHRRQERLGKPLKPLRNVVPSQPCSIAGCETRALCRGWCVKHYMRWSKHGSPTWEPPRHPPLLDRIFAKIVQDEDGCWIWQGADNQGYGVVNLGYRKGTRLVHRFLYKHFEGDIPEGLALDHLCNKGPAGCVNPGHLDPVPNSENLRRAWRDGRYVNREEARRRNRELKAFQASGQ